MKARYRVWPNEKLRQAPQFERMDLIGQASQTTPVSRRRICGRGYGRMIEYSKGLIGVPPGFEEPEIRLPTASGDQG